MTSIVLRELQEMLHSSPDKYQELFADRPDLDRPFLFREVNDELDAYLRNKSPELIDKVTNTREKLEEATGMPIGHENVPISLDTSIRIWQSDPDFWKELIHRQCSLYFSDLSSSMVEAGRSANEYELSGLKNSRERQALDAKKLNAGRRAVHDAIALGCPEIIALKRSSDYLHSITLILSKRDLRTYSRTYHVRSQDIRFSEERLKQARMVQKQKLEQYGLERPLFEMAMDFDDGW